MNIQAIVVIQEKGTKDLSRWIWIHHLHFNTRTMNSFLFALASIFVYYFGIFGFLECLLLSQNVQTTSFEKYCVEYNTVNICTAVKILSCGFVNCVNVHYAVSAVFQPFKTTKIHFYIAYYM